MEQNIPQDIQDAANAYWKRHGGFREDYIEGRMVERSDMIAFAVYAIETCNDGNALMVYGKPEIEKLHKYWLENVKRKR